MLIVITMKHITFLTWCTWPFSLFCLLFIVLCWYIMFVSGICQVGAVMRENSENGEKSNNLHSWRLPWRRSHLRTKKSRKSKGNIFTIMAFSRGLNPTLSIIYTHGVRHEAMAFSMRSWHPPWTLRPENRALKTRFAPLL